MSFSLLFSSVWRVSEIVRGLVMEGMAVVTVGAEVTAGTVGVEVMAE
jgi:hypothetical protein